METLFGDLCSSKRFTHDAHMRDILYDLRSRKKARYDEDPSQQSTQQSSMDQAITDSGPSNPETNSYRTFNPMNQRSPARSSPERIPTASSLPLPIPDPSQRTEESKRTRIHQARQFLKSHPESETFGIGSLPWSSISNSTQSQSSDPVAASQESKGGDTPSFESRDSGPPNPDGGIAARITAAPLSRSNSSRIRREAYLAAKADSYDAWSSVSLLSAGNNHTEEETEL